MKTQERIDKYLGEGKINFKKLAGQMETELMDALDKLLFDTELMEYERQEGMTPADAHKAFMMALKKVASKSGWFKDYFD